jgi:hypothetical protein
MGLVPRRARSRRFPDGLRRGDLGEGGRRCARASMRSHVSRRSCWRAGERSRCVVGSRTGRRLAHGLDRRPRRRLSVTRRRGDQRGSSDPREAQSALSRHRKSDRSERACWLALRLRQVQSGTQSGLAGAPRSGREVFATVARETRRGGRVGAVWRRVPSGVGAVPCLARAGASAPTDRVLRTGPARGSIGPGGGATG